MKTRADAVALVLLCAVLAGGCGGRPHADPAGDPQGMQQEASARAGNLSVHASALPTQSLNKAVAGQYAITRADDTVMLLVGVRRGSDAAETSVPAAVTATAVDLLGKRQQIALHEVRSGEFIDYVGTATVIAPDTLRFDVQATVEGAQPITLQFNRDVFRP